MEGSRGTGQTHSGAADVAASRVLGRGVLFEGSQEGLEAAEDGEALGAWLPFAVSEQVLSYRIIYRSETGPSSFSNREFEMPFEFTI